MKDPDTKNNSSSREEPRADDTVRGAEGPDRPSAVSVSDEEASAGAEREFHIPPGYGDNVVRLMVRDPWTIYSYWETNSDAEGRVRDEISRRGLDPAKSILRVYDVTENSPDDTPDILFDFELRDWAESWYIHGSPGRKWLVDIGILCANGEFFRIARSNIVKTPPNRMSDISDQDWMCPEELYYKMFAAAGGYDVGKSSLELTELMERHLRKWLSSGGLLSSLFGSASFFLGRK